MAKGPRWERSRSCESTALVRAQPSARETPSHPSRDIQRPVGGFVFGLQHAVALGVGGALKLVTGDEPLDGAAVQIEDGGCAAAVPAGLFQNQLQVAALEFLHAGTVGDETLLGSATERGC